MNAEFTAPWYRDGRLGAHRFEFWTADGWLHAWTGRMVPCEEAACWYEFNQVDEAELGGES